ncbi:MAG: molybdenum cofactor carrier protein [Myxococcota bacterium]
MFRREELTTLSPERLPIVGVMGSGSAPHAARAARLGTWLAEQGFHLLTGGGPGVMSSVSEAFWGVSGRRGLVIGIVPCVEGDPGRSRSGYPNPWVEVPIMTHLPPSGENGTESMSRNHINVLSSDVLVALPGGSGTRSELELAVTYGRPVIAWVSASDEIPGLPPGVPQAEAFDQVAQFVLANAGR